MKTKNIFLCLLIAVLVGCVPSLHPLFTTKDAITQDSLLGTWTSNEKKETWQLRQSCNEKDKRYRLIETLNGTVTERFYVTFGKINSMLFADFFPESVEPNTAPFYQLHIVPSHTFAKIEQNNNELKVTMIDSGKFAKLLKNNPIFIKHEMLKDQDSKIVLTASTEELQKFVAKCANDPNVFGCETILTRKLQEPNDPNCTNQ